MFHPKNLIHCKKKELRKKLIFLKDYGAYHAFFFFFGLPFFSRIANQEFDAITDRTWRINKKKKKKERKKEKYNRYDKNRIRNSCAGG